MGPAPTRRPRPLVPEALRRELEDFHAAYADTLDRGDIEAWPDFFTEDAVYKVVARDNLESGLPLCLMLCEGKGMLKDRAYAIAHTEMYAPRYVQHQISLIRATALDDAVLSAEANYVVLETLVDEPTRILQAGRYRDRFRRTEAGLLLAERVCVYDSVVVPNCVVFPA
jgi:anthranilate 1,2-dioxygenase small subunit